ncbi:MAG: hypothetical protein QOI48_2927 [Solirubrobacteraceae bacterium]|nr:hypothetical protein [Solirubrobacteraceae bacterium]
MDASGHKADGLARLPADWSPPYVAVPAGLAELIGASGDELNGAQIATGLRSSQWGEVLKRLFVSSPAGVIVRSSALDEDMSARGLYSSVEKTFPSFQTVGEAIKEIWDDASRIRAERCTIPVLIQTRVPSRLVGHLSNEVRLRKDRRDWVVEVRGEGAETHTFGLRVRSTDRGGPSDRYLTCSSSEELRTVLRCVGGAFTQVGTRFHFEWLWDGARVWIVQCDPISERRSSAPRAAGEAVAIPPLKLFRRPEADDRALPKIRCVADYVAAGIPHADLRVLRDVDVLKSLRDGECPPALMHDLERLASAGVVIRSDYARGSDDFEVLLPRTETEHSAEFLSDFLIRATGLLCSRGVDVVDIAFLTHVFIPADAAAWSLAAPTSAEVRIDATYGLPDGLLYYPHDSYHVSLRRETVRRRVRAKNTILLCDEDGTWRAAELGAPWDWRSTLNDEEVRDIARISKQLADHLGRPVETMFFVRARTADGPVQALPWVHRVHNVGAVSIAATESHFPIRSVEVRNGTQLPLLKEALAVIEPGGRLLVRLKPDGEVLHDVTFLESLIPELDPDRCTVDLAGSALSHVYYELQRAGVQVRTTDPLGPSDTESVSFNKLVRDSIPDMIAAKGEQVSAYIASADELSDLLKRKVIEEAFEVGAASNTNDLLEELGDILDVLEALCTVSGTDLETVRQWAEGKRRERGGFGRGVVLLETRDTSLDEALAAGSSPFVVNSDLGAEVQRARGPVQGGQRLVLQQEIEVPYDLPASVDAEPKRIVIDGQELHLRFRGSGIVITRAGIASEDVNQLTLPI